MAGNAGGNHVNIDGNFFTRLHGHVLHFAVFLRVVATFVDDVTCGDLVPVFFDGHFHSVYAAGFLVAFGEVDHVAIEAGAGTFQRNEHGEIRDRHRFVVDGAAAIQIAVFHDGAEGIDGPFCFVDADDIEMAHQQESARRIGHGSCGKPRDEESAAGRGFDNLAVDAFVLKNVCDVFCGDEFVAGRVGGVDANQTFEPSERVTFELREVG